MCVCVCVCLTGCCCVPAAALSAVSGCSVGLSSGSRCGSMLNSPDADSHEGSLWTEPPPTPHTHTHTGISSSSSSIDCGTNSISVFWPWSVCLRLMTTDWGIVSEPQTDSQSASAAAPLSCTWYLTGEYWLLIIDYWLLHVVLKLCVHISSCTSSVLLRVCSSSCLLLLLHLRTRKLDRLRMDERQTGSDLL